MRSATAASGIVIPVLLHRALRWQRRVSQGHAGALRNLVQDALAELGDACRSAPDSYVVLRARCTHCDGTWEYLAPGYLWAVAEVGPLEEGTCPRCRFE